MGEGIRVAAVDDVEPGEALVLPEDLTRTEEPISLFRDDDGSYYALDDTCSHEDASLAEGWIEAGEVECPLHASRFCLRTDHVGGKIRCRPAVVSDGGRRRVSKVFARSDNACNRSNAFSEPNRRRVILGCNVIREANHVSRTP